MPEEAGADDDGVEALDHIGDFARPCRFSRDAHDVSSLNFPDHSAGNASGAQGVTDDTVRRNPCPRVPAHR